MTQLTAQRRIAAQILGIGINRVWIDFEQDFDIALALTRADVRKLIEDGVIRARQKKGISRGRAKLRRLQRRRGQQRGHGRRRGASTARLPSKKAWMARIRAQRRYLQALRDNNLITRSQYRPLYTKAKGGAFRSVAHIRSTITEAGILKTRPRPRR